MQGALICSLDTSPWDFGLRHSDAEKEELLESAYSFQAQQG